jgi:hypothetical protein
MKKLVLTTVLFTLLALFERSQLSAQATLLSHFKFTSSLVDDLGMGTLTPVGNSGIFYAGGSLQWLADSLGPGGGFRYTVEDGSFTEDDYSVAITFQYSETSGYRKIIDFKQLTVDGGVYVNDQLRLYSSGGYGDSTLAPNTWYTILLTRTATEDTARLYLLVDGASFKLESKGGDLSNDFVADLNGTERVLEFFHDDTSTVDEFTHAGMVDELRIWNGVVDPADVIAAVQAASAQGQLLAYPNPAAGTLWLQLPTAQSGVVSVMDPQGRVILSQSIDRSDKLQLNIAELPSGLYLAKVNGLVTRFVKQ